MIYRLVLVFALVCFWWLIKRDKAFRPGVSRAIWIPTLWVGIISSRPLSMWLGFGGGSSTMEGSPMDALGFFALIIAAFIVLTRRRVNWGEIAVQNWPVFLFYGFLLVSVLWANSPFVSFKRWVKEFGNIAIVLVILTEENPQQAIRAVFVRLAYLLLPMSVVFIRYFPSLGRYYSSHGGEGEFVGVTLQKNSLGVLVLVCGLMLLWDWLELRKEQTWSKTMRWQRRILLALLVIGAYLLRMCDSKTSMLCLGIGVTIILSTRLPMLRRNLRLLGLVSFAAFALFFAADQLFEIRDDVVKSLGRDMTFTGRTDVWRELLALKTDPVIGVGFMSFWDDLEYRSRLPSWIAFSAHSGYVEQYLGGGWVGIFFLAVMLIATGLRLNASLSSGQDYDSVRFAIFVAVLIANFSESNFAGMTPVGFIFLLAAIGHVPGFAHRQQTQTSDDPVNMSEAAGPTPATNERWGRIASCHGH